MKKAIDLDWSSINHFSPSEWPKDSLEHLNADVVLALDELRGRLGKAIYPTPLAGGWYRKRGSKTSRHYAEGRLSDAGDFFTDANTLDALLHITSMPQIGGVGVYLDTFYRNQSWPMFHIDLRAHDAQSPRQFWGRISGVYYYPLRDAGSRDIFWRQLVRYHIDLDEV